MSDDFEKKTHELLITRKQALSGSALIEMVGQMSFVKAEKRAPKSCYRAERFIWLSKLNNLKIIRRGEQRKLTDIKEKN